MGMTETKSMQDHLFKKAHKLIDDLASGIERIEKHFDELDMEEDEAEEKPKPKLRLVK